MSNPQITLHGMKLSGHVHRVEALLELLELPYRYVEPNLRTRASAPYRAMNPLGQVPVLQDGDLVLTDSAAIMTYLVKRYAPDSQWLPYAPDAAARVQRWLSIAAGELRFGPARARAIWLFSRKDDPTPARAIAQQVLPYMDGHLRGRKFLAAGHATIADLACYAYTARAPEGGISLEPYSAVRDWLARVEALPRFPSMPMSREPVDLQTV